jgi:hypothetical protein
VVAEVAVAVVVAVVVAVNFWGCMNKLQLINDRVPIKETKNTQWSDRETNQKNNIRCPQLNIN